MIQVTQKQRDNTLEALNVMWPSVPPENVAKHLGYWRDWAFKEKPHCGTIACFGGWCAWWPSFRAQGVRADIEDGGPRIPRGYGAVVSKRLFGHYDLFRIRGAIDIDDNHKSVSDHELVTCRLKWLIANSEVAK